MGHFFKNGAFFWKWGIFLKIRQILKMGHFFKKMGQILKMGQKSKIWSARHMRVKYALSARESSAGIRASFTNDARASNAREMRVKCAWILCKNPRVIYKWRARVKCAWIRVIYLRPFFQGSWSQAYIALLCSLRLHYIKIHSATFVKSGPLVYSLPFRPHYSGQTLHCRLDGKQCRTVQPMQFCECITQCIAMFANTKIQKYKNTTYCSAVVAFSGVSLLCEWIVHIIANTKYKIQNTKIQKTQKYKNTAHCSAVIAFSGVSPLCEWEPGSVTTPHWDRYWVLSLHN